MTSRQLAQTIGDRMLDKQAMDVVIIDLRKVTAIADFFVISTGSVDVHVKAIVDHVERSLKTARAPLRPLHTEGYNHLNWVLLDYGDVVVHVFQPEARAFYQLERLWGDAPIKRVEDVFPSA
ncbi:MAG: ribosome silencing factor [bacterium]